MIFTSGCRQSGPEVTRIAARVGQPGMEITPGLHELGLGGLLWVNRKFEWKDGWLFVPRVAENDDPLPLLVWLHGGGGHAKSFEFMAPIADQLGVVLLVLDARHNTWDGIDSPFGPDVEFIDQALRYTFERVAIDPHRLALGGISDGGSYALAVGRSNGDLFSHLVAVAPGSLKPPSPPVGNPEIFVAHGTRDTVYLVFGSRYYIVPGLEHDGYNVTYHEFDGPHWVPESVARKIMSWLQEG
jgi:phospholipase/carboxylesterase